jgi:hypothetical protein
MSMKFLKFMVHDFLKINVPRFFEIHSPRFFGIQCPKDFCDFGLLSRQAQAGGGALLYDILLSKSQRPKLLMGGRRWEKGGFEGKKRERKGDRRGKKKKG